MIQIQHRRGTDAEWTSVNPTLASGEIGVETNTRKFKIGDGTTPWNSLDYSSKGDTGPAGSNGSDGADGADAAEITSVAWDGNDMKFTKDDLTSFSLSGAKTALKGDTGEKGTTGDTGPTGPSGTAVRTFTWVISNPATGGVLGPRLSEAHTVTRIDSYVAAATSVVFNIEERSSIGSSGTDILAADQTADTDGASDTSFDNASLASGSWLYVDISAVNGSPSQLVITLTCEAD